MTYYLAIWCSAPPTGPPDPRRPLRLSVSVGSVCRQIAHIGAFLISLKCCMWYFKGMWPLFGSCALHFPKSGTFETAYCRVSQAIYVMTYRAVVAQVWLFLDQWPDLWAGLGSRRILSDSDSDSGLKISTPTPNRTLIQLCLNKRYPMLKRNMM